MQGAVAEHGCLAGGLVRRPAQLHTGKGEEVESEVRRDQVSKLYRPL